MKKKLFVKFETALEYLDWKYHQVFEIYFIFINIILQIQLLPLCQTLYD